MASYFKFKPPTGFGTSTQFTGKAADSGYTEQKKAASQAANRETLASAFGLSSSGNNAAQNTSSTLGVQLPALQTGSQRTGVSTVGLAPIGLAKDGGYTTPRDITQQTYRQTVSPALGTLNSGYSSAKNTPSTLGVQLPTTQTTTKNTFQSGAFGTGRQVTGKAADSGITDELRRIQQQANRQTVNKLFQGTKDNANQSDYSFAKGTAGVLQKGLQQIAQAGGNTLAFAEDIAMAPFELTSGLKLGELSDNAPFNRWAQKIREEGNAVNEYYAENVKAGGKGAEIFDRLGSSIIAAMPQAAAAVLSGGTSAVASTTGLQSQAASALSPGLTSTIRNVVGKMVANPQYWLSFSQTVGNGYENAIADIEEKNAIAQLSGGKTVDSNNIRTKAALQAIGSGLMSAAIEMSGGLQKLPEELRHGERFCKALVDSGIDEGKEEVFQGIIDRASQNLFYDKGNPLVSWKNPNAVFSFPAAVNEFAEGFTVGSILGGGQAELLSTVQAMNRTPYASSGDYADILQQMQAEQERTADLEYARYRELDRKYLDGSISEEEFEELRRLDNVWREVDVPNTYNAHLAKNLEDGYTKIDLDEEKLQQNFGLVERGSEFDASGNPLFATSRAEAAIDGIDYAALKVARKEADAEYGLTDGEAKSLAGYISTTFAMLNKRMYSGTITDKDAGVVERITSALKKFPMFSGTTYRNLKFNNEETYNNFLAEYAEGNLLTLDAFTSTSKRPNGYPKFGQYTVHVVIEGLSGADISDSYGVPRQQEVILLPGTTLKINKVSLANDGSPIIFAQEVLAYGVEEDYGNA